MGQRELHKVRKVALELPQVHERLSHGAPCFFIGKTKILCYYHDNHRGDGRISLWCRPPPVIQDALLAADPVRFFKPGTSASGAFKGWVGIYVDGAAGNSVDWVQVAGILKDAYCHVAPQRLVAQLQGGGAGPQRHQG